MKYKIMMCLAALVGVANVTLAKGPKAPQAAVPEASVVAATSSDIAAALKGLTANQQADVLAAIIASIESSSQDVAGDIALAISKALPLVEDSSVFLAALTPRVSDAAAAAIASTLAVMTGADAASLIGSMVKSVPADDAKIKSITDAADRPSSVLPAAVISKVADKSQNRYHGQGKVQRWVRGGSIVGGGSDPIVQGAATPAPPVPPKYNGQ